MHLLMLDMNSLEMSEDSAGMTALAVLEQMPVAHQVLRCCLRLEGQFEKMVRTLVMGRSAALTIVAV